MNSVGTSAREAQLRASFQHDLQQGHIARAQQTLEQLLSLAPDDLNLHLWLSKLQIDRGQLARAAAQLRNTVHRLPEHPMLLGEAARQLLLVGETVLARACLARPAVENAQLPQALVLIARIRHMLGESEAALIMLERALQSGLDTPHEHHFHGMLLQFVGRIDEAEQVLENCLQRWPGFGEAALTRSRLRRQTATFNHLDELRQQQRNAKPNSLTRASFLYALFKELDDLGRYDEAWPALQQANDIMCALHHYDEAHDALLVDATIQHCDASFCAATTPRGNTQAPTPIFIIGMPRSGTTLLDRMLSNHSEVASAGEIADFITQWRKRFMEGGTQTEAFLQGVHNASDEASFAALGADYLAQTAWRAHGKRFFVDKMPNNFPLAGFIHRALPEARLLLIRREPMAVCFSNYKAMFGQASAHSNDLRTLGRHYKRHAQMQEHWIRVLGDRLHVVDYDALVKQPRETMQKALNHCGLTFEEACVQPSRNQTPVSTPSSAQVREPIHARALDDWQHYADHLQPLRDAMQ